MEEIQTTDSSADTAKSTSGPSLAMGIVGMAISFRAFFNAAAGMLFFIIMMLSYQTTTLSSGYANYSDNAVRFDDDVLETVAKYLIRAFITAVPALILSLKAKKVLDCRCTRMGFVFSVASIIISAAILLFLGLIIISGN